MTKLIAFFESFFDKSLVFTGLNQLWRLVSGPLLLIFIPVFLNSETQGFWFTFTSISALAIFADLGFTTIVTQFAAHEFAYLHFEEGYRVSGDEYYLRRLCLANFLDYLCYWIRN